MRPGQQPEILRVWRPTDLPGVELRRGVAVGRPVPRHWHEELQLCFVEVGDSEMHYRGASHRTPPGSLFIVHPGEVHSNRVFEESGCSYRTLYLSQQLITGIVREMTGREKEAPLFRSPVIFDSEIRGLYLSFCRSLETESLSLRRDSLLRDLFARLMIQYSETRPSPALLRSSAERRAVRRARDYLTENYRRNVSLEELAGVTNLSAFHLNRVFRREVGMPPHAFQIQVRVLRAKALIQQGASISSSAIDSGFADQSHLNRHFKRLAVVTPGQYQHDSKNVQDTPAQLTVAS